MAHGPPQHTAQHVRRRRRGSGSGRALALALALVHLGVLELECVRSKRCALAVPCALCGWWCVSRRERERRYYALLRLGGCLCKRVKVSKHRTEHRTANRRTATRVLRASEDATEDGRACSCSLLLCALAFYVHGRACMTAARLQQAGGRTRHQTPDRCAHDDDR
jgi:hypothetical protein